LTLTGLGFESNTRITVANVSTTPLAVTANEALLNAPPQPDGVQSVALTDPPTLASSLLSGVLTYGAGPNDTLQLISGSNPSTPAGAQAPNPIRVQVLGPDGVTPVQGASVFFASAPAVTFSASSGGNSCTVLTDDTGQASSFVTVVTAGVITITVQLAPASYSPAQQVQTTLLGTSSSLDLGLAPQNAHIQVGATANIALVARALSNGAPLSGTTINFLVTKGSATVNPPTATTGSNGDASTTLEISSIAGDVQVSACVGPNNLPCQTFYGTAVPASGLQLQPVAGVAQIAATGQSFQPIVVRVSDFSMPPNPVLGGSVAFQWSVELPSGDPPSIPGGDNGIWRRSYDNHFVFFSGFCAVGREWHSQLSTFDWGIWRSAGDSGLRSSRLWECPIWVGMPATALSSRSLDYDWRFADRIANLRSDGNIGLNRPA
jgi:hypothetical protein